VRRLTSIPLAIALAAFIHVDFHLARPADHHWSFGLSWHWIVCAGVFGPAGWYVARRFGTDRWRAAAWNVFLAAILGQGLEPVGEQLVFNGRLAFDVSPDRWAIFWICLAAGSVAMAAVLALAPRQPDLGPTTSASPPPASPRRSADRRT